MWNYRFFIVNYKDQPDIKEEINYALDKIKLCPMNESAYSYIRGFKIKDYKDYPEVKLTMEMITKENPECYYAYSLLLDITIASGDKELSLKLLDILLEIDYIRRKYWSWRKERLNEKETNQVNK